MQDLNYNDQGYVVSEGLLEGLNTTGKTAGTPMWLGSTIGFSGIVYGFPAPSAPNHLVYLGVVTRIQSNNGEVFVKIQNGFELEELHNVDIDDPENGDLIAYNSSTQLWENISVVDGGTP